MKQEQRKAKNKSAVPTLRDFSKELFGFEYLKIMEYSKSLETIEEQILYLETVKKERINNPPELDMDLYNGPPLVEKLGNEIALLRSKLELMQPARSKYSDKKIIWNGNKHDFSYLFYLLQNAGLIIAPREIHQMLCAHFTWVDGEMEPQQLKDQKNNVTNKPELYQPSEKMIKMLEQILPTR
ncbi:MAG: hypothetical protein HY965_03240 [Ignavibacteriales bacterium]|nr:hypothetical protein [Ignavibacteriales bacterium]